MPLLIRIMTGLVAGALLFLAVTVGAPFGLAAVVWVVAGLSVARRLEDIE